ncbi:hypothetical protein LRS06_06555 [Hymenobacter sp. J193]|uniref:hypothetical protein n=1 Tax=Hymenobacter sp. J193 TaxID=2898429 RepID=UPI002151DC52|nr:hypothetical protein [Hymenobacter sp. J193]MCR5887447.1 hypothetical protein [Hymenobacter sp. J193]
MRKELIDLAGQAFWYCTDFMVNLANLTHTSYPEANTWVLLIFIPGLLTLLVAVRLAQSFQLRKLRRRLRQQP